MKKSLLALAVLGAFAGAASAQSSVTIYGSLDQALMKGNGGTAPNPGALGTSKAYQVAQSNSSRLGFRGNEDLGGGLSAQFQIEHRFHPDDGQLDNPNIFWGARSYVQLSSSTLGRVYLGRDYTPAFWPAVKSDPFGWDGVGQMGSKMWANFLTPSELGVSLSGVAGSGPAAGPSGVRASNTIGYKSPSFGGVTIQAATGLGEAVTARDDGFNVEYGAGPIYAALGYERLRGGPVVAVRGNSLINFALHYDFGMVKPMFYYARAKLNAGTAVSSTNKFWSLGALAPIGPGTLKAAYYRMTPDSNLGAARGRETKFSIGYDYPFSKRTNVYADYGTGRKTNVAGSNFTNNNAWALGLKHTF